ncbi:MAG: acyl-ACP--UDP-N-acetylglucosamine O-acyltransferase [Phycisphaerales bacterium]|jgi:UDP-N-acetylglucosamine acyltransferase
MPQVHPTACLGKDVELADDVEIGPLCVLEGRIRIGSGTRLMGGAWLQGPLEIGEGNLLWPGVSLGLAPQSARFDPFEDGPGLVIGDRNRLREHVSIHRATNWESPEGRNDPTRIGNDNYLMVNSHVGHDSVVGNHCTLANGALVGGHAVLEDQVLLGGNAAIHQFCRIGRGAMVSGLAAVTLDLMPHFTVTQINYAGSLNMVGLRRSGATPEQIATVMWIFKLFCRSQLPTAQAVERLEERRGDRMVDTYLEFVRKSTRGLVTRRGRTGSARESATQESGA